MRTKGTKCISVLIVMLLLSMLLISLYGCTKYPEDYTLEEHIDNITKKVQKRFMDGSSEYDSFAVYPLYDENNKLTHFLVEFEPFGFLFIELGIQRFRSNFLTVPGMYMYCKKYCNITWHRYRLCVNGIEPQPYDNHEWIVSEGLAMSIECLNARFEADENGYILEYKKSPYYISNSLNKQLYFLQLPLGGIPAIKRGDMFVNLISMENIEYLGKDGYAEESIPPYLSVEFVFKYKL